MLTDTHCHLYKEYYDNIEFIIKESVETGVIRWINNGCDAQTNKEVLELVSIYPNMYGALGIHPENVNDYKDSDLDFIEKNISNKKIVAVGEIGLDYHYGNDAKEEQKELLEKQLLIAEKYNMPVVIHSRDAEEDMLNMLKKHSLKGVIHSFSGSLETAKEYIKIGFLIGVNGIVTFKNSDISNVIKELPLDSIILETDSPYLAPVPFRGKQNSPKHIVEIAEYVSKLKEITMDNLVDITNTNIKRLFDI